VCALCLYVAAFCSVLSCLSVFLFICLYIYLPIYQPLPLCPIPNPTNLYHHNIHLLTHTYTHRCERVQRGWKRTRFARKRPKRQQVRERSIPAFSLCGWGVSRQWVVHHKALVLLYTQSSSQYHPSTIPFPIPSHIH